MLYAEIIVDNKIPHLRKFFDYIIPQEYKKTTKRGMRVIIPFGRKNTPHLGYILKIKNKSHFASESKKNIKTIEYILDTVPFLNEELFLLAEEILKIPFINITSAYNTIIPKSFFPNFSQEIKILDEKKLPLEIKEYFNKKKILTLKDRFISKQKLLELQNKEIIKIQIIISKKDYRPKKENLISIAPSWDEIPNKLNSEIILNPKQNLFWEKLEFNKYNNFLLLYKLHEEKIQIYLKIIENSLKNKKQVLIIVAEIILIDFLKQQIQKYFPEIPIHIFNSDSNLEKNYQQILDIQEEKIFIIIGARKSIFAPLNKIGVIIFDEENDESLIEKEKNPNYDSKELAIIRARYHQIPLIFFTTIPSAESYSRIKKKEILFFNLIESKNKIQNQLIDMKKELKNGNLEPLSSSLLKQLHSNIEQKKKTILFINVKGFSPFVLCHFCNFIPKCQKCNRNLVLFTSNQNQKILKCNFCNHNELFHSRCPHCSQNTIKNVSLGIEYIELFLLKKIPHINLARIDSESIKNTKAFQSILKKLEKNKIDVLLGTEMIAKNLKLPPIETVGIIMADILLNINHFKATEKTFQILTKMSNYLSEQGEMIIQSYNTVHYVFKKFHNSKIFPFLENILEERKITQNPPFKFVSKILISDKNLNKVSNITLKIKKILENNIEHKIKVLGPSYPLIFYKNKEYRMLLTLKYQDWPLNLNFITRQKLNENVFISFNRFANII
ncbi:replication restart helicase PriA ['Camptotheca acuminata' phytoplasma]|uniref:replication restart helicase PriA n=1 Tax='Camptotheca acuminata' phytoplasma TaxID=3239192 RepID=UPI00351AA78F